MRRDAERAGFNYHTRDERIRCCVNHRDASRGVQRRVNAMGGRIHREVRRFAAAASDGDERPRNPLGIAGHGSDIAHAVLFFCSPAARFVSGQVIAVDGAGTVDQLKLNLGRTTG